ncbi:hypothetical protein ILUMI_11068 [Ignelater luminosus]|uniref:Cytochrome P450 n=1 Tax=Ignelater luminosus TaxID=2038154 RepID=A0A8K0D0X2_IGNLU|nr:hypothetical protein ILUMI_11068 [Ignelater luminosus]
MEDFLKGRTSVGFQIKEQYKELKSQGHKHGGLFNFMTPFYMPIDLELVRDILAKSSKTFIDRGVYYNERDDPLSAHLFNVDGEKWKRLRKYLSPTFTSGKLKTMFGTLLQCTDPLIETLSELADNNTPMDLKEVLARFSTDVIGSCAFGLECNSFKSPDAEFRKYGRKLFEKNLWEMLQLLFVVSNPDLGRFLKIVTTPKDTAEFFMKVIKETINYRESTNYYRKDMFQLLIELKNKQLEENKTPLTLDEIAAQAFVFFVGGFETTSSATTFLLFQLASHQDIQQKVRDEINVVLKKHNGKITYDSLADLKYTVQVLDESLRLFPPVTQLLRKCTEDYKIPGTDIVLQKGSQVFIPLLGIQTDPEYFPEPEKFDPERFSVENKNIRHFTHIPFGEGPRMCIGNRFALMQIKALLMVVLRNFKFSVNKNTQIPIKADPLSIVYCPQSTLWLDVKKIVS